MSKAFWAKHSIKGAPTGEPTQEPIKPFVTPGLAKRQQQASEANTEKFDVADATGMNTLNPADVISSYSSTNRAARRVAQQKADVANSALERQQQEAVRRYGKKKP